MTFDRREDAVHNIVAALRFPGPDYYAVLQWLHAELKPAAYVEIGVSHGDSLKLAMPPTLALGIDPCPVVDGRWNAPTQILRMTSVAFFARHKLSDFFPQDRFSLAFIDGSHHFEQVIDDLLELERYAIPYSVIAVHDTLPLDEETAQRNRRTMFYTGDVWKVIPFLKQTRPDLDLVTVRTAPTGLTLIRRLNPSHTRSAEESAALGRLQELGWEYYERRRSDFLETIPNERSAIVRWLCRRM